MDKMRRILVYVCKDGAAPQRAQFVQVSFNELTVTTHTRLTDSQGAVSVHVVCLCHISSSSAVRV